MIRKIIEIDVTTVLKNNRIVKGVKLIKLYDNFIQIKTTKIKYNQIFVARLHGIGIISFEYIKQNGYYNKYVIKGTDYVTYRILEQIKDMNVIYLMDEVLDQE